MRPDHAPGPGARPSFASSESHPDPLECSPTGFPVGAPLREVYAKYDVSGERGFLPLEDPLEDWQLPRAYASWAESRPLRQLLLERGLRAKVDSLPLLTIPDHETVPVLRRLHSLLCLIAHAYLVGLCLPPADDLLHRLPPQLAVPLAEVSRRLGHVPIITHADLVLWNWRRKDKRLGFEVDNLELQIGFLKSASEDHFYLITTELEWKGRRALPAMFEVVRVLADVSQAPLDQARVITPHLELVAEVLADLLTILPRMREGCDPAIFYREVRPYVSGWERGSERHPSGVLYAGCYGDQPQCLYGGSAAQSALVQLLDAFLGVRHENLYLTLMRAYMPRDHRRLINDFRALPEAYLPRAFVEGAGGEGQPHLRAVWQRCVETLREFRTAHIRLASLYIIQQAQRNVDRYRGDEAPKEEPKREEEPQGQGVKGTGGTDLIPFLKTSRDETK